jgi:hypothetical protein
MSQDTMKAHCPRCDGERNCTIHGALDEPWEWTDGVHSVNGQNDHRILRCMGCDTVFYWKSSCDSESWEGGYDRHGNEVISHPSDVKTFPPPEAKDERPDWIWDLSTIDPQLYDILTQTYVAFQNDGLILASVGLRTALDRATEFLKINPGLSLEKKVKALLENGFVGETESRILATVADAGSAAAHRGWSPDKKEFRTLAAALEQFIHRTVIQGQSALDIKAKIPPRHVR